MIVAAILISAMLGRPVTIRPLPVGKLNTFAQITVALLVLADEGFGMGLVNLRYAAVLITGLLTLASAIAYIRAWLKHMMAPEPVAGTIAGDSDD
jgi:cardiolipin synthase